jgi:AraC-like DNA-binding protein
MDSNLSQEPTSEETDSSEIRRLVSSVMVLLDIAKLEVDTNRAAAKASITRASSLLRVEIDRQSSRNNRTTAYGSLLSWQTRRVREYIDAHISSRILISDLSGIVQRSVSHFTRLFKQTFGQTPHAYLLRRRVELAGHLMLVSDASLSDIAYNCGLADHAHLCKLFRQYTGQSPGAWRREHREALGRRAKRASPSRGL